MQLKEAVCHSQDALSRPALTLLCPVQALQPKLEAMEASWYRLHSISGADTPEEVISYWEGESSQSRAHSSRGKWPAARVCLRGGRDKSAMGPARLWRLWGGVSCRQCMPEEVLLYWVGE